METKRKKLENKDESKNKKVRKRDRQRKIR